MHISTTEVLTTNLKLGLYEPQTPLGRVAEGTPQMPLFLYSSDKSYRGNTGGWVENSLFEFA